MRREPTILAMGGGGFTASPGDPALDALVLDLCAVPEPRVLFLPTASGDPREQIAAFHATFGDRCRTTHLSLFRLHGSARPLRDVVLNQDAVYVGGGSLRNMLAIWRAHGLDGVLLEAWERGIVLAGLSAGAMCWFEGGVTMSGGPPEAIEGLGFLPGSLSVHADGEPARLPVWLEAVRAGRLPGGWACDDGVGLVLCGDRLERVVAARPGATALRVDAVGGELVRRRIQPELLGGSDTPPAERVVGDDIREFRALRRERR
ncbi:MAG TPA: peptidase E [Baekduia sp.]|nr:peptidase E [Baekduia sp.]